MKDLKKAKYLILDMDGCVYHPKYLKTLFGQVSNRMTEFISLKLDIDKIKAKEEVNEVKDDVLKIALQSLGANILAKSSNEEELK